MLNLKSVVADYSPQSSGRARFPPRWERPWPRGTPRRLYIPPPTLRENDEPTARASDKYVNVRGLPPARAPRYLPSCSVFEPTLNGTLGHEYLLPAAAASSMRQ